MEVMGFKIAEEKIEAVRRLAPDVTVVDAVAQTGLSINIILGVQAQLGLNTVSRGWYESPRPTEAEAAGLAAQNRALEAEDRAVAGALRSGGPLPWEAER